MSFSIAAKLQDAGIDLSEFDDTVVGAFEAAVEGVARAAHNEWIRLAQARLKTSQGMYIDGLRQSESYQRRQSPMGVEFDLSLVGKMPNNIEFGMPSFDMKAVRPGWLGGGKAKTGKDGKKYVVIPFRHSTSSDSRLAYTGKAAAVNNPDLKTQLKRTVKAYGLDRVIRSATGQVVQGPAARVPNNAPVHPYLKGLTRVQTSARGTTPSGQQRGQGQLMTWRVMSENSKPGSWIHPGIDAANILSEVEQFVDTQLDNVIKIILGDN